MSNLQESDFQTFIELVRRAQPVSDSSPDKRPVSILCTKGNPGDLLHRSECARLQRSLKIAFAAGDMNEEAPHRLLDIIVQGFPREDPWCLPLTCSDEWIDAIGWAMSQPQLAPEYKPHRGKDRQFVVGMACQALRRQKFPVHIGVHGSHIDDDTRTQIAQQIDFLISLMGGMYAINRVCRIVRETNKLHGDMWLLGNMPVAADLPARPAVPIGWFLSLALKHIHKKPCAYPADAWSNAVGLATDFAASVDCQRYNQFDGMFIGAHDFYPTLVESLAWREFFTLPQFPPSELPALRDAFSRIEWPKGTCDVRAEVDQLFSELARLIVRLSAESPIQMSQSETRSAFPLLWACAQAPRGAINTNYLDPSDSDFRDHDRYIFFETSHEHVVVLPSPLAAVAGCEAIFRLVWKKAGSAAGDIVGNVIEKSVAIACGTHAQEKVCYSARGKDLEMDVAVCDGEKIVLFEAKAKPLRAISRTGDMMAFIEDYTKSFAAAFRQLVRHDHNIRHALTPLTEADEDLSLLRVTKVAVSPLSYGPVSDHFMVSALFRSIACSSLNSLDGNVQHDRILNDFSQIVRQIVPDIDDIAPQKHGQTDLFAYMLDVFWLDIGQLLYIFRRGPSVVDALSPLRNVMFSTRDFWTEVAFADRLGLTEGK